ncbi:MAG: hypothetical protein JNL11_11900 [Bdellovibrionaceae bacterium]|nr:hypothetical protein [Pseudobdellovibrionaceae bacterium]
MNLNNLPPHKMVSTKLGLDHSNLNRVLQMSKYDTRGMAKEFERVYIEHYLHSVNDPFKTGISFSTNTSIYIRSKQLDPAGDTDAPTSKDIIPFTFDADNARVYFVRFPKDIVAINEASKYFRQYEVLKSNIALPFGIVDNFSTDFFNSDGVVPTDKVELKKMTDFESTFTTINVSEK